MHRHTQPRGPLQLGGRMRRCRVCDQSALGCSLPPSGSTNVSQSPARVLMAALGDTAILAPLPRLFKRHFCVTFSLLISYPHLGTSDAEWQSVARGRAAIPPP